MQEEIALHDQRQMRICATNISGADIMNIFLRINEFWKYSI